MAHGAKASDQKNELLSLFTDHLHFVGAGSGRDLNRDLQFS
jgi:hypothetical protein